MSLNSNNQDRKLAELEYRFIQTELKLAKSEQLYLVLNFSRKKIQLKMRGALVWDCPMQLAQPDSQKLKDFVLCFMGKEGRVMLPLRDKHLYSWQEKTPDSVLTIVGEVVKVDPLLLQRNVPAHFGLFWDHGLSMDVRTKITEESKSVVKSSLVELRHALRNPFGKICLVLIMESDDALTFHRAVLPETPTILSPSDYDIFLN